jgi:hypothetical protein
LNKPFVGCALLHFAEAAPSTVLPPGDILKDHRDRVQRPVLMIENLAVMD